MKDVQVYDQAGREQGAVALKVSLTKKELAPKAYATAVRVILQNRRQGTVGVKGRSDVSATGKKPWKQKGTGRARAGSASSPIWRKGGVTHGPTPRTRILKMGRKQRAHVYNNIFFERLDAGRIKCLEFEKEFEKPSTKLAFEALKNLSVTNARTVVFLNHEDVLLASSFRNIPNVSVLSFDQPNAYDLTNGAHWVFLKKDMDPFKKMIMQWN